MLASPFEPQAMFEPASSRGAWRDSWETSLSSVHERADFGAEERTEFVDTAFTDFTFKPVECAEVAAAKIRARLMAPMKLQPLRTHTRAAVTRTKTPAAVPVSAWSDSDDSESDYEANSACDSDTDVEGCQCLPKYAGMPVPDSPKSQSSEFTAKPAPQQPYAATKRVPRSNMKTPILSPSETVMERYAPLGWSEAARDALKNALEKRQRAMEDAGVSHFIQIEALHNCLKDVAFGVSLREAV
ncbi:hypothetical protein CJU90_0707 [Yarrowia sp. C11]|nr:hypothetical protein CKK34_2119 [Yarrowia sp. E02]KAG5373040.1 hypothetical protein CJU90_0707 [Yarrowia sp. C11]